MMKFKKMLVPIVLMIIITVIYVIVAYSQKDNQAVMLILAILYGVMYAVLITFNLTRKK